MSYSRSVVLDRYPDSKPIVRFGLRDWEDVYAIWSEKAGMVSAWCRTVEMAFNSAYGMLPVERRC